MKQRHQRRLSRELLVIGLAWRLSRGQAARMWLLISCIALGIAARVCVGSFSSSLDRALTNEARPLLGADIEIASNLPFTHEQRGDMDMLLPKNAQRIEQIRFTTMALGTASGLARTIEVRAVEPGYPLYGQVDIAIGQMKDLFGDIPTVFVQEELLSQLDAQLGSTIQIGAVRFQIGGIILEEPGMSMNPFALGPRVLMAYDRVAETGLDGPGSRLRFAQLIALPHSNVDAVMEKLREHWKLPKRMRSGFGGRIADEKGIGIRSAVQASENIERAFDRIGDFLRLVALAAVLLGGIGVASLVRGFVADQRDAIATLYMLGATPRRVAWMFFLQSTTLGCIGGIIGAIVGVALQNGLLFIGQDLLPIKGGYGIDSIVMLGGVLLGVFVAAGFAAIAVNEVHGLQPAAMARGDATTASGFWRAAIIALLVLCAVMAVAAMEARSWRTGPAVVGLLVLGALITTGIGWPLLYLPALLINYWRGRSAVGIRHGLRNMTRPGFRPLAAIIAIAAAAQLMATMATYRVSLTDDLSGGTAKRPGTFCIDIQSDQIDEFRDWCNQQFHVTPSTSHMVMARLRAINGKTPNQQTGDTREGERQRFMRGREQRLSWRTTLGQDEIIMAGKFMEENGELVEASLEQRFANNIGAELGDTLTFDIQGVELEAKVTSIRSVKWANMRPNFFILLSPHALRDAPGNWVAAIPALPEAQQKQVIGELAQRFPSVTAFDVAEIGGKLHEMITRISQAVTFLGWFCLAAGIVVLIGIGIGTARARRGDAALLSVVGAGPGVLFSSITAEFATLAGLAAIIGTLLGIGHAYLVLKLLLDLQLTIPWTELTLLIVTITSIGVMAGLFACRHVFTVRPLVVLRDE